MTFTQNKKKTEPFSIPSKIETPKSKKKLNWKAKLSLGLAVFILLLIILGLAAVNTANYFDKFKWSYQQPVIVQKPLIITERQKIIGVLSKDKNFINFAGPIDPNEVEGLTRNEAVMPQPKPQPIDKEVIKALIHNRVVAEWGEEYWPAMEQVLMHESGFQPYIVNKSSGACGLGQALPCSKMKTMDITYQIGWVVEYTHNRYKDPIQAWNFWQQNHWW